MFTASIILVNNAVTTHCGAVNGLVSSITALVRAVGPALGTACLGWSENAGQPVGSKSCPLTMLTDFQDLLAKKMRLRNMHDYISPKKINQITECLK